MYARRAATHVVTRGRSGSPSRLTLSSMTAMFPGTRRLGLGTADLLLQETTTCGDRSA
jgi:hypothetical protein